jgi:hypothetical protein
MEDRKMTTREFIKNEIDVLPEDAIGAVRDFVLFQKYRAILDDDTAYLEAIPGMIRSIEEGINTPLSECVPISDVWKDV